MSSAVRSGVHSVNGISTKTASFRARKGAIHARSVGLHLTSSTRVEPRCGSGSGGEDAKVRRVGTKSRRSRPIVHRFGSLMARGARIDRRIETRGDPGRSRAWFRRRRSERVEVWWFAKSGADVDVDRARTIEDEFRTIEEVAASSGTPGSSETAGVMRRYGHNG